MLLRNTFFLLALGLAAALSNNYAFSADDDASADHDSATESSKEDDRVRQVQVRLLESKADMGPLLRVMEGMRADITAEKFDKLVDKTEGLKEEQRKSLKESFRDLEKRVKESGEREAKAGNEFIRALSTTVRELESLPRPSKPASDNPTAKNDPKADGKADDKAKGEDKAKADPLKAVGDLVSKLGEQSKAQDQQRERDAALAQLKGALGEGKEGEGKGSGDKGQGNQGNQNQTPPTGNQNQNNDRKNNKATNDALHNLNKDSKNDGNKNRGVTINNEQKKDDEKKNDNSNKRLSESKPQGGSAEDIEAEIAKSREEAKKKAEAEAEAKAKENALGALAGATDGAQTGAAPRPKKSLNALPLQAGLPFNPPSFGNGFDPSSSAAGPSALAGATVSGGGGGGGGGGGDFNLSGMNFGGGESYGPAFGSAQFEKSGGFQDGGAAASVSDGESFVGESDNSSPVKRPTSQQSISLHAAGVEVTDSGNIFQVNHGKMIWKLCTSARPGQVGVCSQKRFRRDLTKPLSGFAAKELDA